MQGGAAEEGIGAVTERRADARLAEQRSADWHEGHQAAQAIGEGDLACGSRDRRVEGGRGRVVGNRDERTADAALRLVGAQIIHGEAGLGDHRAEMRDGVPGDRRDLA